MTEQELNKFSFLIKECSLLEKDLSERKTYLGYKSPKLSRVPKTVGIDYTGVIDEICDLEKAIYSNLKKAQRERVKIEKFLGTVKEPEIRLILRLKHIALMTFEQIGTELNMDRRTVSRKYYKYLQNAHNAR